MGTVYRNVADPGLTSISSFKDSNRFLANVGSAATKKVPRFHFNGISQILSCQLVLDTFFFALLLLSYSVCISSQRWHLARPGLAGSLKQAWHLPDSFAFWRLLCM